MKTKRKKRGITSDAEALVARVKDLVAGRQLARKRTLKSPSPAKPNPSKFVAHLLSDAGKVDDLPIRPRDASRDRRVKL